MRLWQLMTLTLALMASVPLLFRAVASATVPPHIKAACARVQDAKGRETCAELGAK